MSKKVRTHEDADSFVCLVCMRKGKTMRTVNQHMQELIRQHVMENYDRLDTRLPNALCATCRLTSLDFEKENFSRVQSFEVFDCAHELRIPSSALSARLPEPNTATIQMPSAGNSAEGRVIQQVTLNRTVGWTTIIDKGLQCALVLTAWPAFSGISASALEAC
jgi:hypothetical protein